MGKLRQTALILGEGAGVLLKTGKQVHRRNCMAYRSIPSLTTKKLFDYEE